MVYEEKDLPEFIRQAGAFFQVRRHKMAKRYRCESGDWRLLGSGYYGEAWVHTDFPGLVLKISGPQGWGSEGEAELFYSPYQPARVRPDAWPVYAEHCFHSPAPHKPEILAFTRASPNMAWAVMPRYSEMEYTDWDDLESIISRLHKFLTQGIDVYNEFEWAWPLRGMVDGMKLTADIHQKNVMLNEDGDWILTDPFSSTSATPMVGGSFGPITQTFDDTTM